MDNILPITNSMQNRRKNKDPEWTAVTTHDDDDDDNNDHNYHNEDETTVVKDDFSYKTFKKDVNDGYEAIKTFVSSLWTTK